MEGMFLQSVPVVGSLVSGGLLLATVLGAVLYGWLGESPRSATEERHALPKAA